MTKSMQCRYLDCSNEVSEPGIPPVSRMIWLAADIREGVEPVCLAPCFSWRHKRLFARANSSYDGLYLE
ncbi:MAG: hypothetical protein ACERLB_03085 [Gammaproteobacteria bacterium]